MFWPKDKKRYENLKSSFTNLKLLIEDLYKSSFNGFLEVRFEGQVYYILIEQDYPERIYIKDNEGKFLFNEGLTADEIYDKSLTNQASIDVYELDPEKIDMFVGYLNAVPLYTNLSSEFTDFERLTSKLSKDGLNGYLEVKFLDPSLDPFYLLYAQGGIKDIFQKEKSIGSSDSSIKNIKSQLEKSEAHFNVFQSPKEKTTEKSLDLTGEGSKVKNLDAQEEAILNSVEMDEVIVEDELENEMNQEPEQDEEVEVLEEEIEEIGLGPSIEERMKSEVEPEKEEVERVKEETEPQGNKIEDFVITPYLEFAEALIQWVEKSVNRHMGNNYFSKAFKKGLLNVSDKYPFLDPFLAEFTYVDGKIQFSNEDTKAVEFLKGIYAAIDMIFEELASKKRDEIAKTLKHNLRDLERRFHEEIEILRVRTLMPTLFQ